MGHFLLHEEMEIHDFAMTPTWMKGLGEPSQHFGYILIVKTSYGNIMVNWMQMPVYTPIG
jgi:hypothetical protein